MSSIKVFINGVNVLTYPAKTSIKKLNIINSNIKQKKIQKYKILIYIIMFLSIVGMLYYYFLY